MVPNIRHAGKVYQAARCPRCGIKIYPARDMRAHEERHEFRDELGRVLKEEIPPAFLKMKG